jgi:purine-binding chemotaxis protein CheW
MAELKFEKEELQLIVFKLGSEEYTVPIEVVQEIIMPQKATHIPKAASFIEGVINLRGNVIPVIDGRKKFEISNLETSAETRIIVLELESHTVGLIVDSVSEVVHLKTASIEPPPLEFGDGSDFIIGVGKLKDRLLILLDPNKFLSGTETQSLTSTVKMAKSLSAVAEKVVTPEKTVTPEEMVVATKK